MWELCSWEKAYHLSDVTGKKIEAQSPQNFQITKNILCVYDCGFFMGFYDQKILYNNTYSQMLYKKVKQMIKYLGLFSPTKRAFKSTLYEWINKSFLF